jgi:hypothetical protein
VAIDSLSKNAPIIPICLVDENGNKVNLNFLGLIKGDVLNFAALPAAAVHSGEYYMVQEPQGTWVLGTKKRAGIYRSNGSTWTRMGLLPIDDSLTTSENLWSALKIFNEISLVGGTFTHTQAIAATTWSINHNLSRFPSVSIVIAGKQVFSEVSYVDNDNIDVIFKKVQTGTVYLN